MKLDTKELQHITLLYVEDDVDILNQMTMLYGKIFKQLFTASDGKDGFEIFKNNQKDIDIIVTDINMPNMNGLEMIKEINNSISNTIPTIVTTAHTDSHHLLNAMDLKVDKYIPKPVQVKELTISIVELVQKYRKSANLELLAKGLVQKKTQFENLTQELQTKLDLKTKEAQYLDTVVDNFVLTFQTNKNGDIENASSKFLRYFEYIEDELIGQNINILRCDSCHGESFQQIMLKAIHTKKTISSTYTLKTNSDKKAICDLTMTPLYGSDGLVCNYKFFLDVV